MVKPVPKNVQLNIAFPEHVKEAVDAAPLVDNAEPETIPEVQLILSEPLRLRPIEDIVRMRS